MELITERAVSQARTPEPVSESWGWRRYLLPSGGDVVFAVIFFFALQLGSNLTQRDGDLGRHIALGRSIIDDGQIPTVDIYSHTMSGGEMVPHEWLSQAAFAGTERWLGFDGIGVLTALLAALPWAIMYRWLVKRGRPIWLSLGLVTLGVSASITHWASRPHIFTWVFFVVWVTLLEDFRNQQRTHVWWLVPLAALWANTHGAFVVGFILVGTYLVGSLLATRLRPGQASSAAHKHLLLVLAGTFFASMLNPSGIETIVNGFSYVSEDFLLQFTGEYNSPDFHNPLSWPFLLMILLTLVLPHRWNPTSLLLTLSWTVFALYSLRNIPLYAIVMTPVLAGMAMSWWASERRRAGSLRLWGRMRAYSRLEKMASGGLLSLVLVAITAFAVTRSPQDDFGFKPSVFPIAALEVIGEPPGERVFNFFIWGGYLEYCCHPAIPVFIDGQTDYYGTALTVEYDRAIRGLPEWRQVFADHQIDWVLIPPETGLAEVLTEADGWREVFRDQTAVVYVGS